MLAVFGFPYVKALRPLLRRSYAVAQIAGSTRAAREKIFMLANLSDKRRLKPRLRIRNVRESQT
jgi:hypothetical protein